MGGGNYQKTKTTDLVINTITIPIRLYLKSITTYIMPFIQE